MTAMDAETILSNEKERLAEKYKSIEVLKEVAPVIDLGNLLLTDHQPITDPNVTSAAFLKSLARDNAQLLFNQIFQLPVEKVENVLVVKLPALSTLLPRDKPVPKAKPPTKWEAYAAKKGIQNKKRGRMIWDEEHEAWKPRFGYKRGKDDTNEWCIEVPEGGDPMEDQFKKKEDARKENVAKNELKRLRNVAKNMKDPTKKGAVMSTEFKPSATRDKVTLAKEIDIAKESTASVGKFQGKLRKEKPQKSNAGKKRKFESTTGDMKSEKTRSMEVWDRVNSKKDSVSGPKATVTKVTDGFVAKKKKGGGSGKVKNKHANHGLKPKMNMTGKTIGKKGRK